jgi:hypothetical protein
MVKKWCLGPRPLFWPVRPWRLLYSLWRPEGGLLLAGYRLFWTWQPDPVSGGTLTECSVRNPFLAISDPAVKKKGSYWCNLQQLRIQSEINCKPQCCKSRRASEPIHHWFIPRMVPQYGVLSRLITFYKSFAIFFMQHWGKGCHAPPFFLNYGNWHPVFRISPMYIAFSCSYLFAESLVWCAFRIVFLYSSTRPSILKRQIHTLSRNIFLLKS